MSDEPDDILDSSVREFLEATGAKSPTPGGGSVAALAGAMAASLGKMSLEYTLGKKQFEEHREAITLGISKLGKAAGLMQDLVGEDMAAYRALAAVLKLPPQGRTERADYLTAVVAAIRAPLSIGGLALHILQLCHDFLDKCNPALVSDLGVAAALAHATVHAAELNVLVNAKLLPNVGEAEETRKKAADLSLKADTLWHKVREHVHHAL